MSQNSKERRYPPMFEKSVPVILGVIAISMVLLVFVSLAVVFGIF